MWEDGWVTQDDFLVAVVEGKVDAERPQAGPHLPSAAPSGSGKSGSRGKLVKSLGPQSGSQGEAKRADAATTGKALRDEAGSEAGVPRAMTKKESSRAAPPAKS